ncbi:hypothetical protein FHU35_12395 [Saccharopolyspora dendranthemae]|uniref:Uncharacterized protein n=1 Tax=Saccharopolyspora dendranthemae TaxID=1181886 RepID=A0A561U7Q6_9PSEU|nr:hypothetical protein FHU35_12395 [Saccharopolyspora dendranthemae]
MANNAHLVTAGESPGSWLVIRDDRGSTITELELPHSVTEPAQAEKHLHEAGWSRSASAEWTRADDGWVVPVVPS